jgi:hypothetical protein
MPDQLYRRCPDCRESESGASCPTCGGERFIPTGIAPNNIAGRSSRRWRIRISTLMLLVVIAGLASYIVADLWHRAEDARRMELAKARAIAEAWQAEARAAQAQARIPAPAGPTQ